MSEGKRSSRRPSEGDLQIILTGKELEEIKEKNKKNSPLSPAQKKILDQSSFTMNRNALEAYQTFSKMKSVEMWICRVLNENWTEELYRMETTKGIAEAFAYFLRDGRRLCEVVNKIKPEGTIKRVNHVVFREAKQHIFGFKAMENLWFFLEAVKLWVKDPNQTYFDPMDLFESKNIKKVVDILVLFAQIVSDKLRFEPRYMEIKFADLNDTYNEISVTTFADVLEKDEQQIESFVGEEVDDIFNVDKMVEEYDKKYGSPVKPPEVPEPKIETPEEQAKRERFSNIPKSRSFTSNSIHQAEQSKQPQQAPPSNSRNPSSIQQQPPSNNRNPSSIQQQNPPSNNRNQSSIQQQPPLNNRNQSSIKQNSSGENLPQVEDTGEMSSSREHVPQLDLGDVEVSLDELKKKSEEAKPADTSSDPQLLNPAFKKLSLRNKNRRNTLGSSSSSPSSSEINYAQKSASYKKKAMNKKRWNANEIMKGLYLGSEDAANDFDQLEKHNITHILNVIGTEPVFPQLMKYMTLNLLDSADQDIISAFPDTNQFIAQARASGSVLVHCQKGISRSSTVVIAYVMSLGYSFYDAADLVCEKRPVVCPNLGFIKQLQLFEKMNLRVDGNSEHHILYQKLKQKSMMLHERISWFETPSNKRKYLGEEISKSTKSSGKGLVCKGCKKSVIPEVCCIGHEKGEGTPTGTPENPKECTLHYILPFSWMGDISKQSGDFNCPHCRRSLGKWDWNGLSCGCSAIFRPAFAIERSFLLE